MHLDPAADDTVRQFAEFHQAFLRHEGQEEHEDLPRPHALFPLLPLHVLHALHGETLRSVPISYHEGHDEHEDSASRRALPPSCPSCSSW